MKPYLRLYLAARCVFIYRILQRYIDIYRSILWTRPGERIRPPRKPETSVREAAWRCRANDVLHPKSAPWTIYHLQLPLPSLDPVVLHSELHALHPVMVTVSEKQWKPSSDLLATTYSFLCGKNVLLRKNVRTVTISDFLVYAAYRLLFTVYGQEI